MESTHREGHRAMTPSSDTRAGDNSREAAHRVSRGDIESKLRELQGDVDEGLDTARSVGTVVAVGAAVVLVVVAYWLGRRRGRKRSTIVEIRRI